MAGTFGGWLDVQARDQRKDGVGDLARHWKSADHPRIYSVSGIHKHLMEDPDYAERWREPMLAAVAEYNGEGLPSPADQPEWAKRMEEKLDQMITMLGAEVSAVIADAQAMTVTVTDLPAAAAGTATGMGDRAGQRDGWSIAQPAGGGPTDAALAAAGMTRAEYDAAAFDAAQGDAGEHPDLAALVNAGFERMRAIAQPETRLDGVADGGWDALYGLARFGQEPAQ